MLQGKMLLISLLATGIIAALLGLVQMWAEPLGWTLFTKIIISLIIAGTLISFLIAVDYDLPGSRSKFLMGLAVVLGLALAGLLLGQIWWSVFDDGVFGKLLVTDLVLLALISFILAVYEDFGTNKKLKDEKYID